MRHLFHEKLKVTIETPDGKVIDMTGMMTDFVMTVNRYPGADEVFDLTGRPPDVLFAGPDNFELTIRGIGPIVQSSRSEYAEKIRQAREWRCPYCGHINEIAARTCGSLDDRATGCGASRPFIYGSLQ